MTFFPPSPLLNRRKRGNQVFLFYLQFICQFFRKLDYNRIILRLCRCRYRIFVVSPIALQFFENAYGYCYDYENYCYYGYSPQDVRNIYCEVYCLHSLLILYLFHLNYY